MADIGWCTGPVTGMFYRRVDQARESRSFDGRIDQAHRTERAPSSCRIGASSFDGGSATNADVRQSCLGRGWLRRRRLTEVAVVSKATPDISILAIAVLTGRSAAELPGSIGAVVGLMTPSIITFVLAWLHYRKHSSTEHCGGLLHALFGVAAGFAVAMALQFLRDVPQGRPWRHMLYLAAYAPAWLLPAPRGHGHRVDNGHGCPRLFDNAEPNEVAKDQECDRRAEFPSRHAKSTARRRPSRRCHHPAIAGGRQRRLRRERSAPDGYFVGGSGGTLVAAAALAMPSLPVPLSQHGRTRLVHIHRLRAAMNATGL